MPGAERLVFDTNVVLSGIIFPLSISARAILKAQSRVILASEATQLELAEVIRRDRFDRYVDRAIREQLAAEYVRACRIVEVVFPIRICRDPRDDKFLEVALHGNADAIITGDKDLLVLHPFRDIPILTPGKYLDRE
ncbi:MAG: putative toxin-antitoxin system toxin component, PIN family [Terracidiphilus sp.]